VIEATYERRPQFHRHWQIFVQSFLKVFETCDNVKKLYPKHIGGGGGGGEEQKNLGGPGRAGGNRGEEGGAVGVEKENPL